MKNFNPKILAILFLLVVMAVSCSKDKVEIDDPVEVDRPQDFTNDVALEWMQLFLEVERFTAGYRPPVSGRAAAYITLAGYESIVEGMSDEYNSLEGQFSGMNLPDADPNLVYHWPTVLNAAYSTAIVQFFPTAPARQQDKVFTLKQKFQSQFRDEVSIEVFNRSDAHGTAVANAMYEWSKTDALGHDAFLRNNDPNYSPPQFEGSWQPTYPDFSPGLLPYWGQVRTFAANSDDKVPPPIPFSTDPNSLFYQQAKECKILTDKAKDGTNYVDRWIADFWSDDCPALTFTPAGRWIAVANQVVKNHESSLDEAVLAYAKVGMGLNDAGVRCWGEKYTYNLLRPIDYIRQYMGDANWNTVMCPDVTGNFYTPNFPAYPSGHATFGGVAAEVLTDIYGTHYSMTDRSHEGRPEFLSTPRTFGNFYEMAVENGYSRLPLGVHYRMDAEAGVQLGYKIGRKINNLPWRKRG